MSIFIFGFFYIPTEIILVANKECVIFYILRIKNKLVFEISSFKIEFFKYSKFPLKNSVRATTGEISFI